MKSYVSLLKEIKKNPKATVEDIYNAAETDPTIAYNKEQLLATLDAIKVIREQAQVYGNKFIDKIIKEQERDDREQLRTNT